jgi:cob(I)alamin adenosyltransferase
VAFSTVGDPVTAAVADARQAVYFRKFVNDLRRLLLNEIAKRNAEITRRIHAGQPSSIRRLRSQMRGAEAEVQQLDRMIWRLDCRFKPFDAAASVAAARKVLRTVERRENSHMTSAARIDAQTAEVWSIARNS